MPTRPRRAPAGRRRRRTAVVPVVLAVGALAAAAGIAPAASADLTAPAIGGAAAQAGGVVLATLASPSAAATLSLRVTDAGGVDRVVLGLYDPTGTYSEGRSAAATRTAGTAKDGTWTATVPLAQAEPVGAWTIRAFATDLAGNMSEPDTAYGTFSVRHPVRFASFNAGPEPTAAGGKVLASGRMQRFVPGTGWVDYGNRLVRLEYRAPKTSTWVQVGASMRTRSTGGVGPFEVPPAAAKSGFWRLYFGGTSMRAPATSGSDYVEVKLPAPPATPSPTPAPVR
jgi:hypothetical protein